MSSLSKQKQIVSKYRKTEDERHKDKTLLGIKTKGKDMKIEVLNIKPEGLKECSTEFNE